jgi:hypothetical protein
MRSSLRIFLEGPSDGAKPQPRLFIPGDIVAGKVVLTLQEATNIASISIELKGCCGTQVSRYDISLKETQTTFYSNQFLTLKETLFTGPFKMRASTYEYPFSFRLPETFDHKCGFFNNKPFAPEYRLPGPKPMPPTCKVPHRGDSHCGISYHLTARIPRTFSNWDDIKFLTFSPVRTEPDPAPIPQNADKSSASPCRCHYRITDEGTYRKLTMGESMKEAFHHSAATSTVNFTFNATVPTTIVIGNSPAIDMTLICLDSAKGNPLPPFTLKSYALFLKSWTTFRARSRFFDVTDQSILSSEIMRGTLNIPLPPNETISVNGLFPTDETYTCPTFVHDAVKREYALELKVVVDCLGEESNFKLKSGRVVLLAARMIGEGNREILMGTGELGMQSEQELPRYEERDESASEVPRVEGHVSDHKDVKKG